ncbi:MAG TPA: type II secretion system F family protein [Bdellovibrionota bacterium]|nr:type II secretion system F family protein [Bdellovibrionota bacterium]
MMEWVGIGCIFFALRYLSVPTSGFLTNFYRSVEIHKERKEKPRSVSAFLPALYAWAVHNVHQRFPKSSLETIGKTLERAGLSSSSAGSFVTTKILFCLGGMILGFCLWLATDLPVLLVVLPLAGFIWPSMRIQAAIRKRQREIVLALPYYLDLLTLALEAGLDLVAAVEEIILRDSNHPLRDELAMTLKHVKMGNTRSQAFTRLSDRTGVESLTLWASAIRQSEELGSSLGSLLRLQSEALRKDLVRQAEEQAQKAPVKMLLPLIGLIFPVVFILLFAPIGMRLFSGS